jgi:type I restriction enzyme, S subunit
MATISVIRSNDLSSDLRIDAEYYQPHFIENHKRLVQLPHQCLSDLADISDGNHLSIAGEFCESGIRYLRGQDLSDFFIADADPLFIPESTYKTLARSHMHPEDVLVSVIGTVGAVGIVGHDNVPLTGSCKLAIIRSRGMSPSFIAAYLASASGQSEIKRCVRGAVQPGLILPDLRTVVVPLLHDSVISFATDRVAEGERCKQLAEAKYKEAERILSDSLRLPSMSFSSHTTANSLTVFETNRFDAEFFCTPDLFSAWKSPYKLMPLADVAPWINNGATPGTSEYSLDEGVPILKVGGLSKHGTIEWLGDRVSSTALSAKGPRGEARSGDIFMLCAAHHIRYIGKCGVLASTPEAGECRSVGELITIRTGNDLGAETLCTYFNLAVIQTQIQKLVRGQSAHLYPSDLRYLPVPMVPAEIQERLKTLHSAAVLARRKARVLVAEAATAIDVAIQAGGASALQHAQALPT